MWGSDTPTLYDMTRYAARSASREMRRPTRSTRRFSDLQSRQSHPARSE